MADRRKLTVNTTENVQETDRQFMDKHNVSGLTKDLLSKLIENRPDDPIKFIASFFETLTIEEQASDLVNRAVQVLNLTHHSRPVFESNIRSAYDILGKYKVSKRICGVNGLVHSQLLQTVCKDLPSGVTLRLLKKLECADYEAVTFNVFKSSVFTAYVLNDYVAMANNLFASLDIQHTGKADKNLCDATLEQLKTALGSSRMDVKRIVESSYSLSPDGLYNALDRAMNRQASIGFVTQDQFVQETCETFLSKVKKLR